jgi:PKD repeat protein
VSYDWNFGDGTSGTGDSVTHDYSSPTTYSVTLTVKDAFARSVSTIKSVTVVSGGTPTATFTFSPSSPNLGDTVFFNATASTAPAGRKVVSYAWNYGDGSTGAGATVSHKFDVAGSYRVSLTVTDDRGAVGTSNQSVTVATQNPTAAFVFSPSTPGVGTPVFFDASQTITSVPGRTIVSYAWVFGDGATGSGKTTSHAYKFAGTFAVTLTVTDNVGERSTKNGTVPVSGTVTAAFKATPTTLVGDRVVNFDASASTGTGLTYTWNFGDGNPTTVSSATITHAFQSDEARNVVLTVTDIEGNSASITNSVTPEP